MKRLIFTACCCLAASAALGADAILGGMPRGEFADTEAATNVPFAFQGKGVRDFRFVLDFAGTPSNNVQLAFGRDLDLDGVLSADEADMTFAWDCGEWRVENGTNLASFATAAATTNSSKRLEWDLRMKRTRMRRLDVLENGVALFPELVDSPEPWFYSPDWDILRLTARGVDASAESAGVALDVTGYTINLR